MQAETEEGFRAYVEVIDDPAFQGLGADDLLAALGDEYRFGFLIVGDRVTVVDPEHPLLVVDLIREPGRSFRALPRAIQSVENNLSLANMDFFEFAESVDEDGIFRGFE